MASFGNVGVYSLDGEADMKDLYFVPYFTRRQRVRVCRSTIIRRVVTSTFTGLQLCSTTNRYTNKKTLEGCSDTYGISTPPVLYFTSPNDQLTL